MNQLQEINILFKKRIEQLEKKKQKCMDYSSTPNRCVNRVQAQIERTRKLARISRMRTKPMESKVIVDSYLELVQEGRPKSPMGKLAVGAVGAVGAYKAAKWGVKRSDCKEYKYSPYLHKRCMKGLEEAQIPDQYKKEREALRNKNNRDALEFQQKLYRKCIKKYKDPKKCALVKQHINWLKSQLNEAEGMEGLPKGWTQSSLKKFSKSLTGKKATQKGFFDKCVKRMQGKIDNPEGFCASVKDERHGSTYWRGKGKTPQQAGKDVKRIRNVKQESMATFRAVKKALRSNPEVRRSIEAGIEMDKDKAYKKVRVGESESFLDQLYSDTRTSAKEWQGPNIPYGDDSNRPNLIRKCTMMEDTTQKINCLRKLRDQAAMNPFYQYRIDRYIDEITDTYEPTKEPGTIPGNEFKETGVGEDTK